NTLEILNGNRSLCVFSLGNDPLTHTMVGVFLEALLASREFLEVAFCRLRADFLKLCAAVQIPLTLLFDLIAAEALAITISDNVYDTQIKPQGITCFNRFRFLNIAGSKQEPFAVAKDQIAFALL